MVGNEQENVSQLSEEALNQVLAEKNGVESTPTPEPSAAPEKEVQKPAEGQPTLAENPEKSEQPAKESSTENQQGQVNWEERYKNLQSHSDKKLAETQQQLATMSKTLSDLMQSSTNPLTEEEAERIRMLPAAEMQKEIDRRTQANKRVEQLNQSFTSYQDQLTSEQNKSVMKATFTDINLDESHQALIDKAREYAKMNNVRPEELAEFERNPYSSKFAASTEKFLHQIVQDKLRKERDDARKASSEGKENLIKKINNPVQQKSVVEKIATGSNSNLDLSNTNLSKLDEKQLDDAIASRGEIIERKTRR